MNCPNCRTKLKTLPQGAGSHCSECEFVAPKNYLKITELYAWVSVDQDDKEGIIAYEPAPGVMLPMVFSDKETIEKLRPFAERISRNSGIQMKLVRFTERSELHVIKPQ